MSIYSIIRRLRHALNVGVETFKFGGCNYIKIVQIHTNNLLDNKNIVVTGGGSGIGLAIASRFINAGANVIITGRDRNKLEKAIKSVDCCRLHYIVWDVSDTKKNSSMIEECINIFKGEIDILVNNAGVQPKRFFLDVDIDEWNRIYNINSKGTFFLCQDFCRHWKNKASKDYYKIINISSQGAFVGATYPYRMSKWDIRGLTEGIAREMASHGILVNGIAPGVVRTNMQNAYVIQGENTFCNQNYLKRISLPEEVAELALFMTSDACNFMVGQTILIDGGYSIKK